MVKLSNKLLNNKTLNPFVLFYYLFVLVKFRTMTPEQYPEPGQYFWKPIFQNEDMYNLYKVEIMRSFENPENVAKRIRNININASSH